MDIFKKSVLYFKTINTKYKMLLPQKSLVLEGIHMLIHLI